MRMLLVDRNKRELMNFAVEIDKHMFIYKGLATHEHFKYLENRDRRMRFNNSQDPIYYVFDCIENRPVSTLAKEFVKDSVFEVINFVSKVVG